MHISPRALFLFLAWSTAHAFQPPAPTWDPNRQAVTWAFQEVDGSLIFFDSQARALRTWMKGSGLLASLPITLPETRKPATPPKPSVAPASSSATDYDAAGAILYGIPRHQRTQPAKAKEPAPLAASDPAACSAVPERWATDSYSRTWMACEDKLAVLGKDGQLDQVFNLPAPVEDLAVARDGIYLLYRTLKPCLEKRDLRTGAVLWTFGDRDQLKEAAAQPLRVPLNRMALGVDGMVYLAEGASMAFTVLDPGKGPKEPGQTFFTCDEAIPAKAVLGRTGRGPLLSWAGRDVIFGVFTPSQVKSCGAPESKGLLLARYDLAKGTLQWLPTSLAEGHRLVGLLETEAVFLAPGGGLAYTPIR